MTLNRCGDCGICCLNTEMILFDSDIELIINNILNKDKKVDLFIKNSDGLFQLNNIDGHCVFFDPLLKTCQIYEIRPKGCRFYPLIYNILEEKCVLDEECPRPNLFYQGRNVMTQACNDLKDYLKKNEIF